MITKHKRRYPTAPLCDHVPMESNFITRGVLAQWPALTRSRLAGFGCRPRARATDVAGWPAWRSALWLPRGGAPSRAAQDARPASP